MVSGVKSFRYEDRREKLRPLSVEKRKLRGDLPEVLKITRGLNREDREKLFRLLKGSRTID